MSAVAISGKHLKRLKEHVAEHDYCFLCDCHPSSGHGLNCPLASSVEEERETCAAMAESLAIIYSDGVPSGLSFNPFKKLADEMRKRSER